MILQWILHPTLQQAPQPGQCLKIFYDNQIRLAYPYKNQGTSTLCFVAERLESKKIDAVTYTPLDWKQSIVPTVAPIIITVSAFYERLYWCLHTIFQNFIVLELPLQHPFKRIPSTFIHPTSLFLPHEIATLSIIEEQKIACRLIGPDLGCIPSKEELLSRWHTQKYVLID